MVGLFLSVCFADNDVADADDRETDDEDEDDDVWDDAGDSAEATSTAAAAAAADRPHHHNASDVSDVVHGQRGRFDDGGRSGAGAVGGRVGGTVPDREGADGTDNRSVGEGRRDCDCDLGRDHAGCLASRNSGADDASSAAVVRDGGDHSEETAGQSSFVRQQRMKWLEANSHTETRRQSDSQPLLVEKLARPPDKKPNPVVSSAPDRNETIAAASGPNPPVAARERDTAEPRRTAAGSVAGSGVTQPAAAAGAGNQREQNGAEDDGNGVDRNAVRDGRSDATDVRTSGSRTVVGKERTESVSEKSCDVDEQQRVRYTKADESSKHHATGSESQRQQQPQVTRGRAGQSVVELVACLSSDGRQKQAADEGEEVRTAVDSISPDPSSNGGRTLASNIRSNHSIKVAETSSRVVPETASRTYLELRHLQDSDRRTDSASSATRSDELLHFNEPLIEDDFDVYVSKDWLVLPPWQGRSTSESFSAPLHLEVSTIEPPEAFADTDETPLKLPYSDAFDVAIDKREADGLAEETQTNCKSFQDVTPNCGPNVEGTTECNANSLPGSWSCRNGVGVGEVSTRFTAALPDGGSRSSTVGDVRTTAASVRGVCDENEVVHSQTSSSHSDNDPVSRSDRDRETATDDATKQPLTSQHGELFSGTSGELKLDSPHYCSKAESVQERDCDKFSADVPSSWTVQEADLSRRAINAIDDPTGPVWIDGLERETNRPIGAETGYRLTEIPAAMEADFLEQMHRETCPTASRCSTADFSSEMLLSIMITHVVDDQYFWGQIVNEGIQVTYGVHDIFQFF